jgi:hypothetical protein
VSAVQDFIARTTAASGVPTRVEDANAIAKIAALLSQARKKAS